MSTISSFHYEITHNASDLIPLVSHGIPPAEEIINIHRAAVPYQDKFVELANDQIGPDQIPPYIWYNIIDMQYQNCLSGEMSLESYTLAVEIVAFNLTLLDEIKHAFILWVDSIRRELLKYCLIENPNPPPDPPYEFTDLLLLDMREDYQPMNQIAVDLGGFLSIHRLDIYPAHALEPLTPVS